MKIAGHEQNEQYQQYEQGLTAQREAPAVRQHADPPKIPAGNRAIRPVMRNAHNALAVRSPPENLAFCSREQNAQNNGKRGLFAQLA